MNIRWDAEGYRDNFAFVHQYGESVLELIKSNPGALAVDIGCGNGALSCKLAERGYRVIGIDASEEMLKTAEALHPELNFQQGDACSVQLKEKADIIFSNAVFHWIDAEKQQQMLQNLADQLKEGGELVCEFGGKGCAETVHAALERAFERRGLKYRRTFYFPTIGMYAPMLEKAGFRVEYAVLFERPTEQKQEDGLREWINMFVKVPFEGISAQLKDEIIWDAEAETKEALYHDGKWYIDYIRIRFRAVKEK